MYFPQPIWSQLLLVITDWMQKQKHFNITGLQAQSPKRRDARSFYLFLFWVSFYISYHPPNKDTSPNWGHVLLKK